jgi:hypothetical protein
LGEALDGEETVGIGRAVVTERGDVVADDEEMATGDQGVCCRCEHLRQRLGARVEVGDDDELAGGIGRVPLEDVTVYSLDVHAGPFGMRLCLVERDPRRIDQRHGPSIGGEPQAVAPRPAAEVEAAPGWEGTGELHEERIGLGRPQLLGEAPIPHLPGVGAFAIIVYTVLAPSMPSAAWGWVPGALFGLGTTAVQVMVGGLVGWLVRRKGASPTVTRHLGLVVAARTLGVGGIAFVLGGLFGIAFPHVAALSISTGVHVHNLDHLGLPLVLVVVSVAGVGVGSLLTELHRIPRHPPAPAPSPP